MFHQPFSAAAKILLKPNIDARHIEFATLNEYAARMIDIFPGACLQQRFGIFTRKSIGVVELDNLDWRN